jgi:hypothetical protein
LNADTFIVHSWQSRYDFVTKAKTFQKAKQRIDKKNAKSHLDRFVSDADHWRSIFDTDYQWGKPEREVAKSLDALRVFGVVQPTPGILSLIRAFHDQVIKYRSLRNAIEAIEKFHFSFNAVTSSRSSGGISGMYSSFGRAIFNADDGNEVGQHIFELVEKLREREPIPSEFDAGFEQIVYTKVHSSQKTLVQYILKKMAIHEGQPSIGESDELTIEHLVSQSKRKDGIDERVIGQLGNLLLVDAKTNEMLSTNDFGVKKQILKERGYILPEILQQADKLDEEVIRANTARISEAARGTVWRV